MKTQDTRIRFNSSSRKLRRARRLYYKIISKDVEKSPELVFSLAEKVVEKGFFSSRTSIRSVRFHLLRGAYSNSALYDWNGFGWYEWLRLNGADKII